MADTTKRHEETADQSAQPESGSPIAANSELQVRIPCRGKSATEALSEVRHGLADAEAQKRDPLLVFEDLGLLEDSVATLIKGLCRLLVGYPHTVTFWESSGYTEAFLSVMEASKGM